MMLLLWLITLVTEKTLVKEIPILVFFLKCVSVYFFRYFYVCVGGGGGGGFDKGGIRRTRSNQRDNFFFLLHSFLTNDCGLGKSFVS